MPGRAGAARQTRYVPHIYTDPQMAALFAQTDRCHYCAEVPLRHLAMPVLFRTIYACGLRCSEARLYVSPTSTSTPACCRSATRKAAKTGRFPPPPTTRKVAGYHGQVAGRPNRREWFFPGSRPGEPLTLGNVDHNFRRFLWQARISHGGPGHGPRVHDLRHTLRSTTCGPGSPGRDVGALLPVLQTYLGHSSIADTAYYLQ